MYRDIVHAKSNLKVIVPLVKFLFTLLGTSIDCERRSVQLKITGVNIG